ncbi:MAG: Gfo/Idh/MocA family oxidoreductase [Flavobacteriaceae bacterium]|nr:Gfo/Idh/MocA family oxidoreductase [Flavobacteriaceae bacterium]
MANKIRLGILGGGGDSLIGVVHRIASNMFDRYELVGGCFNPNVEENKSFANRIGVPINRVYASFDVLIEEELKLPVEERMEVISVLTPNFLHFPMAKKLLEKGFNVICEKPLTTTHAEALELEAIQKEKQTVFAVTYTYTGYPMVRQMKDMIRRGVLGTIQKVDLQYYQGWINSVIHKPEERAKVWRLDPKKGGLSCCIGDIGTHAFDMLEYVTGMEVKKLLADLNYLYEDNPLDIDGTVLIRMSEYCKGVIRASQIATAEENNFTVQIYGSEGSLKWRQENPNELVHLTEGLPMQVLKPGHDYLSDFSLDSSKIPPGHPEGIFDSMGNIYNGVAKALRNEVHDEGAFPTLHDGVRGMLFIEKVLDSNANGNTWVDL